MSNLSIYKSYNPPPICEKEILRYAGVGNPDSSVNQLVESALLEASPKLCYKVCYMEFPLSISGNLCDFGEFRVESNSLSKALDGCRNAVIFAATVGIELDRLIMKYSKLSPSKALMLQAIGTERIEALCDVFVKDFEEERGTRLTPRFSPGYGDLSLSLQKEIFGRLGCEKRIGLTLNSSLLMSPTKSVTAIAGVTEKGNYQNTNKCSRCDKKDCIYRGVV